VLLGVALKGVPREQYTLCTKLGRYDLQHFDFSARRVAESIDVSLHRLGTDHLDLLLCHDIEFVPMQQIVDETLPAIRKAVAAGKVRFVGFSGYPQKIFRFIADQAPVDCVLSYNQYTLQNTRFAEETVPYLKARGIGIMITDHNVRETLEIIDRAAIIHAGELLLEGTPAEIVDNPEVRRVYLGEEFA
jgi:aryl-alcohol dehydrogenase-like predicted oxidoreductase